MKEKVSNRDWESLSAFLDDQLTSRERNRLETRLKVEPELNRALEELRQTRALLRGQPRVRAPRNFMLTPQMAGITLTHRRAPGAYPILRLASVLASVFFVILLAGDLLLARFQSSPAMVAQSVREEVAPVMVPGMGGGGGGAVDIPPTVVEAPVEATVVVEDAPQESAAMPTEGAVMKMAPSPTEAPAPRALEAYPASNLYLTTPTPAAELELVEPQAIPVTSEAMVTAPPIDVTTLNQPLLPPGATEPATPMEMRGERGLFGISILRLLQVILALLAIITTVAAIILRR